MNKFIISTLLYYLVLVQAFAQTKKSTTSTAAKEKWNVLSIVLEDMSCKLAAYGDSTISTPNIDRLSKEGITFDNAYACVGVCAPSRAGIITGMFPTAIGAHNMLIVTESSKNEYQVPMYEAVPPADVRCFTEFLRAKGVYCENQDKTDYQFVAPATAWDATKKLPNHQDAALYADFPVQEPFYKVINFWQTHESQLFPNGWMRNNITISFDSSKVKVPPYLPNTAKVRSDIAHQYNNLKAIDEHVGVILDGLEKKGLLDHTIVLFYTDHGDGLPRAKRTVYESGVKVPLMVRFPDKRMAGSRNKDFIYLMDIGPTVLSMYNISIPGYMHGKDFLFDQKSTHTREYMMYSADRFDAGYDMIRAIRYKQYKYIRNFQPQKPQFLDLEFRRSQFTAQELYRLEAEGKLDAVQQQVMPKTKPAEELFDLDKDPFEIKDISKNPENALILKKMRMALDSFQRATGDMGFVPEKDLAELFWPKGEQPQTKEAQLKIENSKALISCETPGASIGVKYNNNSAWTVYTSNMPLPAKADSLYVLTHRIGYKPNIQSIKIKSKK